MRSHRDLNPYRNNLSVRRCLFLARSYISINQYPESVSLLQRAQLYARESLSLFHDTDALSHGRLPYYVLTRGMGHELQESIQEDEARVKQTWFAYNGGSTNNFQDVSTKPLFFDIALNYLLLNMERLRERANLENDDGSTGIPIEFNTVLPVKATKREDNVEVSKSANSPKGTLTGLLGAWWGRK